MAAGSREDNASKLKWAAFFLPIGAVPDIRCGRFGQLPGASVRSAATDQLVEHVIRNDGVTGSSPVCGTGVLPLNQSDENPNGTFSKSARRGRID
jgi:hypothetical protein